MGANARKTGIGWLVSIDNSGAVGHGSPTWQPIGLTNQKTLSHGLKNKIIDVTGKNDGGFRSVIAGIGEISISVDFSLLVTDPAYIQMKSNYKNQVSSTLATKQLAESYIQIQRDDSNTYVYWAWISDLTEDAPVDKELIGKVTFEIDGPPVTWVN